MTSPDFQMGAEPAYDIFNYRRPTVGWGQLPRDTRQQPHMRDSMISVAEHMSMPQAAHSLRWELRHTPGIKAKNVVGEGYDRPGPKAWRGAAPTDYFANPEGLDKYVGARDLLGPAQSYGSGYPADPMSRFPTMKPQDLVGVMHVPPGFRPRDEGPIPASERNPQHITSYGE